MAIARKGAKEKGSDKDQMVQSNEDGRMGDQKRIDLSEQNNFKDSC